MILTEMFLISYDLSWFSSLKNSHILLLVQIIIHIDDVIKNADVIKIADIIQKYFFVGLSGLFIILLNYLMFSGDDDNMLFLFSLSICHQILGELNNRKYTVRYMHITLCHFVYHKKTMNKVML